MSRNLYLSKSILEADEVPFYVQNDNFGSLYSGTYINYFNAKTVMVPEEYYEDAKEIIQSVIKDAEFVDIKDEEPPRVSDLVDNLISILTLGLYSPGGEKNKSSKSNLDE